MNNISDNMVMIGNFSKDTLDLMTYLVKNLTEKLKKEKIMHKFEDFKIGTRVKHEIFGAGKVTRVEQDRIKVVFDKFIPFRPSSNAEWVYNHHKEYSILALTIIPEFTPKFKKGDKLVCVRHNDPHKFLKHGEIYTASSNEFKNKDCPDIKHVRVIGSDINFLAESFKKIEYHPIDRDNIARVLKYNNIENWIIYHNINIVHESKRNKFVINNVYVSFDNPNWLQHIELETGKLKPLPIIPEFDFHAYMLENGFTSDDHNHYTQNTCRASFFLNRGIFCTIPNKENADIWIELAKLHSAIKYK